MEAEADAEAIALKGDAEAYALELKAKVGYLANEKASLIHMLNMTNQ